MDTFQETAFIQGRNSIRSLWLSLQNCLRDKIKAESKLLQCPDNNHFETIMRALVFQAFSYLLSLMSG